MKTKFLKRIILMLLGTCCFLTACNNFLSIDPPIDKISSALVFNNEEAAKAAIIGIYSRMITSGFASGNSSSITVLTGLYADELISYAVSFDPYYKNSLLSTNLNSWTEPYQYIYTANAIIEGLALSPNVSTAIKDQLTGEALFIRAFCYLYLTNLFGDIPLHLTTDFRINTSVAQTQEALVYQAILADLETASQLLGNNYNTAERVRPNKWTAIALMSRVYLYARNWSKAEELATSIIENKVMYTLKDDLKEVFLNNSTEAIWQLLPNKPGQSTNEGNLFILTGLPGQVAMTTNLANAFEKDDKRKTDWTGSIAIGNRTYDFPFKYKVKTTGTQTEYSMVLRLAEQYLIRSEARINQEKIGLGIADLNILRKRARPSYLPTDPIPLPDLSINLNRENALHAVEQERRVELFTEWGHRWFDLKRTGRANDVLSIIKSAFWQSTDLLFPIPQTELNANPLLIQNHGY